MRASSLNYRDLTGLRGDGRGPTKIGVVPLSDGAGEVAAIGEKVTRVKVGDRIAGCFHPRWFGRPIKPDYLTDRLGANLHGVLAEYAVLSEEALVHTPHHLSFEEAATLPCAAVTAQVAFSGHLRVTAGDIILAQDSGDVSVFALQLARILGAQVIATTSATEKAERLKVGGVRGGQLHRGTGLGREGTRPDQWPRVDCRRDRRARDDRDVAGGTGRWWACKPDWCEPVVFGSGPRSLIADRPRHYARLDQSGQSCRFRGYE